MKILLKIFLVTLVFTVVIYYLNYNFFLVKNEKLQIQVAEEMFIENSISEQEIKNILNNYERKKLRKYLKEISFFNIRYFPSNYKNKIIFFQNDLKSLLRNNIFENKIKNLTIDLFEKLEDRRGNMKDKHIRLYGINKSKENEYVSVFIHELGHFIDLYFFEKSLFLDVSDKFYEISWQETKIKNKNQTVDDFVSGYAITNKYEDFAETFDFYILHNKEFLVRTKNSLILKKKYDFFSQYFFKNKQFFATDFSYQKFKKYYWDVTKIPFLKDKFFSYLEKQ